MKIQKLIILGILKESPKHGYEIKKIFNERLGIFTATENRSIYYPLQTMEKRGLIKKSIARGQGKLVRYVYALTPRGDAEFQSLALDALRSQKRPFIDIDIPLYFLPYLEKHPVLARLRLRRRFLERVRGWLSHTLDTNRASTSVHQNLLLTHHLNLLRAEEEFLEEMVNIVKK